MMSLKFRILFSLFLFGPAAAAQTPTELLPIEFEHSAEFRWLNKEVIESRMLDDMSDPDTWTIDGTGTARFTENEGPGGSSMMRVDMQMYVDEPAPTGNGLSSVNLSRAFAGEDWSAFNRISIWIRPEVSGFPMLPLQFVLHNEGSETVPDVYYREGIHYATLTDGAWQQVVWEITPLSRDSVTAFEIGYWVNKKLAERGDRVAFEVGRLELQRVAPDHYEGWDVAPGRVAFSHTGYQAGSMKTALASDLSADAFRLVRIDDTPRGEVVLETPVEQIDTRLGRYQKLDFSEIRTPGEYVIQSGDRRTQPFRIDENVWRGTIWKTLNFFFGERCGFAVPGSHGVDHRDWFATHGEERIVMNGGWHDAGDLSQGLINTGEAVYAMFALAARLQDRNEDPELLARLVTEGKWGLDWLLRVRFDGGYRIGFASHNLWTNGIIGDADDRSREALNNPNVNYIAAAAQALAYRVLKYTDPELARRALRIAEDDWRHAIEGIEGPETWSTPAYAASPIELAGIGILASLELFEATGREEYANKAVTLAGTIVNSQQIDYVGSDYPLAGFFYHGPEKQRIFHQFHRGNDQAPILAMARLAETFPHHEDWMAWYAVVARYSEFQKRASQSTEPFGVLPAYVYHDTEYRDMPETLNRYRATPEAYREQVLEGRPMGDGYYLRAFPVWFGRRGNFGVLLSQSKALSAAAHLRRDSAAAQLAQKQAQWIVGRNPFSQSTMYGEGYDWTQQYSVSSGDFVGSLPVGMKTRGTLDVPYWPPQNMYVYKEVWVHPSSRWLWLMEDVAGPALIRGRAASGAAGPVTFKDLASGAVYHTMPDAEGGFRTFVPEGRYAVESGNRQLDVTLLPADSYQVDLRFGQYVDFDVISTTSERGDVSIELRAVGDGTHTFELRTDNLNVSQRSKTLTLQGGGVEKVVWTGAVASPEAPWVAVIVPNGDITERREAIGELPRYRAPHH